MTAVSKICSKTITAIGTALLLSLVFMNFFTRSYMPLTQKEHMEFYRVEIPFMVLTVSFILLFLILLRKKTLRFLMPQIVSAITIILYLGIGLVLISHVRPVVRSDVRECFLAAQGFSKGDFSSLKKGAYLFENAHQIGFVLYEMMLTRLSQDVRLFFLVNLLLVMIDNLLIVRFTSVMTGGNREAVTVAGLLALLFFPHLFFILFGYNQIISMTLMLAAAVNLCKFIRTHSLIPLLFMILFSFFAVFVRGNAGIFVVAEIIVILLHWMRRGSAPKPARRPARRNSLCLAAAILLILTLVTAGTAMRVAGEKTAGQELPRELPKTMWIAMGMQDGPRAAGWYNGYIYRTYRNYEYDLKQTEEDARKEINDRLQVFLGDPGLFAYFYTEKICSTWCEPTFESIWSGPLEDMGQHIDGKILHKLYTGGLPYAMFANYCSIINIFIFFGAFVGLFLQLAGIVRRKGSKSLSPAGLDLLRFPGLVLIGGFIFHLLWETKSQYVMFYVYMLIPLAAFGYACVSPGTFAQD